MINETLRYITQLETELIQKMLQKKLAQTASAVPLATTRSLPPQSNVTTVDLNNNLLNESSNAASTAQEIARERRSVLKTRQLN